MTRSLVWIAICALVLTLAPERASACGGCFGPVGSPTVVTRHQMVVSLSTTETTLWDQIEYAGEPEDFVWVLPVRDGAPVELAQNAFFEALESVTTISLQAPPATCNDPCGSLGSRASSADREGGGVIVHYQAAIGPYETATIGSSDPDALVTWLRDNSYTVPDAILPTIRHYTDQGMDFAVLRLSPNFGVNQMQPVRVSMPGLNPTFPLRMVSAGVEGSVGLELFVFAEGRYGPMNFASAEVDRDALVYDWDTASFNYDELYAAAAATEGGRAWVTEYADRVPSWQLEGYVSRDPDTGESHSATEDYEVATRHITSPYLTRLTADMAAEYLDEDLILGASSGGALRNFVNVTRERNRDGPVCPTECNDPYGTGTAGGWRGAGRGDGLCSVSPGRPFPMFGALGFGVLALVFVLRRRRR